MIRALVHDPVAFYPAGISLITIISESTNTALIGLIGNLFCHVYLAIMRKYRGAPNGGELVGTVTQTKNTVVDAGDMTLTFLDVTAQLTLQKENAVTYAELKCTSERTVEKLSAKTCPTYTMMCFYCWHLSSTSSQTVSGGQKSIPLTCWPLPQRSPSFPHSTL